MGEVIKAEQVEMNGAGGQSYAYGFTEAPASVNVRLDYHGYNVQLTLRDATGTGVLERLDAALAHLEKRGIRPAGGQSNGATQSEAPLCPTHGQPMRPSKYGGWYCGAKVAEDGGDGRPVYCKCKQK